MRSSQIACHGVRRIVRAAFIVAAMSFATSSVYAQTYIFGRAELPVGNNPVSVANADFNGDGIADLVVVNSVDNTVSVLIGKLDGTFETHVDYPTGSTPLSVATGDFNGDGNLDLAVVNENCVEGGDGADVYLTCGAGTVSIFLGVGDGTFFPKLDYTTGTQPVWVATADLNGDGKLDLAVVNQNYLGNGNTGKSSISVLLGNGDGTFLPQVIYATASPADAVAIADTNGDHRLDLVVASGECVLGCGVGFEGSVSVLLGNGDGTFQTHIDSTGAASNSLVVADFNGDGRPDVALGGPAINVFLGNGDGTFVLEATYVDGSGYSQEDLVGGDFNGDGKLDLVSSTGAGVFMHLGNGDGTFQTGVLYGANQGPDGLVAVDVNGDGKLDIVAADTGSSSVSVLLGLGDGTFVNTADFPSGNLALGIASGDFNKDGVLDLATVGGNAGVSVLVGKGDGTFQTPTSYPVGAAPYSVAVGDFNRDGNPDLAVVNQWESGTSGPGSVSILLGNGDGTFQAPVDYLVNEGPLYLALGDFNGDGNLDIAVTNNANFNGNTVSILLGNGDGTFRSHVDYFTPTAPLQVVTGDFNLDGKLDLAIDANDVLPVSILLGNGDGTFQSHMDHAGGNFSIVAGDFNGDGKLDLATNAGDTVEILPGNGDGTFGLPIAVPTTGYPNTGGFLSTADFNADGKLDLVSGGYASLLIGNGDWTFQRAIDYLLYGPFVIGDFNGDGVPDIVGGANYPSSVEIGIILSRPFKAVNPNALNFGSWGLGTTSTSQTITIGNPSNVPFTITGFVASANFAATNNCPASLTPGMTCTVMVTFTPGAAGLETGTLTMTDGTRSSPQAIALAGTGVNGPFLSPSPARLNFDAIGVGNISSPQTTTLINAGNAVLTLTGITITGANSADYSQTNNCGGSLAVSTSCSVTVKFAPSAGGSRLASLSISDNGAGSPQLISLVGVGAAPVVGLSPTSLTFGSQALGTTSSPQTLTLTNSGSAPLDITQISAAGDFAETNTCSTSLAAGSNCEINVTFTPTALGARTGNITVTDNASGNPQTIAVSGIGGTLGLGIGSGSSNTATVSAGKTATYTLSIGGGGVAGIATLTCSGAPTGASCSVPASVNVSATTPSTFTVSVTTTARSSASVVPNSLMHSGWLWAVALLGILILPNSSRKRRLNAARCLPIALLLFIASCGGSSGSGGGGGGGNGGTPAGNYTITVKATSGTLVESVPLTLTVQ